MQQLQMRVDADTIRRGLELRNIFLRNGLRHSFGEFVLFGGKNPSTNGHPRREIERRPNFALAPLTGPNPRGLRALPAEPTAVNPDGARRRDN